MHSHPIRVYYEDTDLAGIVYYANYLKFIERGRTEALRSLGVDQMGLKSTEGIVFAVRKLEADFVAPAHMDDELLVQTDVTQLKGARIEMHQRVMRCDKTLFEALVTIAALTADGKPARIPAQVREALAKLSPPGQ